MPTSNSSSGKGRKISLPLYLPSNSRSWRDEESSIVGQNTTVEVHIAQDMQNKHIFVKPDKSIRVKKDMVVVTFLKSDPAHLMIYELEENTADNSVEEY